MKRRLLLSCVCLLSACQGPTPSLAPQSLAASPAVMPSRAPNAPVKAVLKPAFGYQGAFPAAIRGRQADFKGFARLTGQAELKAGALSYRLAEQPWQNAAGESVDGPSSLPERWRIAVYHLDDKGQRYGFPVAGETHRGAFGEISWNGVTTDGSQLEGGKFEIAATPEGFAQPPLKEPLQLLDTPIPDNAPPPEYETDYLLVRFAGPEAARPYQVVESLAGGWSKVAVTAGGDSRKAALLKLAQELYADPGVAQAAPDLQFTLSWHPNDSRLNEQYALGKLQAEEAWNITQGDGSVVIAIVDTGVDPNHPDLRPRLLQGWNALTHSTDVRDDFGHGTHCAGIAAAIGDNGQGIAGLAPNSRILPVKVLGANGSGSSSAIAEGIRWAADHGAQVINLSLGASMGSEIIREAIVYAIDKGVTVLAAMGNDGGQVRSYPAAYAPEINGLVSVGASDSGDQRAYFSNYGSWITVAAPGSRILSTLPQYAVQMNPTGDAYGLADGTSMATPYVTGLAALLKAQQPGRSPADIESALIQGADDIGPAGFDNQFGFGRINALRSLTLTPPSPTPTPSGTPRPSATPTPTTTPATGVPGGMVLDID